MRIIQIVPGSGGTFYCQNCLRDHALVRALRAQGHDALLVPLYLPAFADDPTPAGPAPVFYGAVSLYLEHQFPWLRRWPRGLIRWLDAPPILRWAARRAGSTRASGLDAMTLSMLRGEHGQQSEELERLVEWLASGERPAVIHLSNALLLGLARQIKKRLGVPLVCSLQDEDTWIEAMPPASARQAWDLLAERAAEVDRFIAVSRYYGQVMQPRLRLAPDRMRVIPIGIDLDGFAPAPMTFDPPVIGYLSRLTESLGLGLLVEAFFQLKADPRFSRLRLRATGGQTGDDHRFLQQLEATWGRQPGWRDFEIVPASDRAGRLAFLQSLSVLSVPVLAGEAFGTYLIEALAAGVPVVQPQLGAFPELIEATGGGLVYTPNTAAALASALGSLLAAPDRARQWGAQGRQRVFERFGVATVARQMLEVYQELSAPAGQTAG